MQFLSKKSSLLVGLLLVLSLSSIAEVRPPRHPSRPVRRPVPQAAATPAPEKIAETVEELNDYEIPNEKNRTGWDVWSDLNESAVTYEKKPITVVGTDKIFMFGGEKEASSSRITRVMTPSTEEFKSRISSDAAYKEKFKREFMDGFVGGRYRVKKPIVDAAGKSYTIDLSEFKKKNFKTMPLEELEKSFDALLGKMHDQPFTFLTQATRSKIFNSKFEGLSGDSWTKRTSYYSWKPMFGDAEKYLVNAHGTSVGWEMNFKPQKSYGEFENMIQWYRTELANQGVLFEAPGHQWLVFPEYQGLSKNVKGDEVVRTQLAEIYKNMQAHTVLSGIEGKSGIEIASYKALISADQFAGHQTGRGVIRLERNRFKVDDALSFNVEQRAGTKMDRNRRFLQSALISRYATGDLNDLKPGTSYELFLKNYDAGSLSKRFGLSKLETEMALNIVDKVGINKFKQGRSMIQPLQKQYLIPFWNWEKAPYVSKEKAEYLKKLTQAFVKNIAELPENRANEAREYLRKWVEASDLRADIEDYLKPKPPSFREENAVFGEYLSRNKKGINVNDVDLGIEFSARFPMKTKVIQTEDPLPETGRRAWVTTEYDMSVKEKDDLLKKFANTLSKKLNKGQVVPVVKEAVGGHGHSIVIGYDFKDSYGQPWKVEWDGVGRDYDQAGNMIENSIRGGHIEIVTPKFKPSDERVSKVYETFKEIGVRPSYLSGGGHVNVDLAVFDKKPKAMARFLSVFLENRATVSMMYQHPGRLASAEPNPISEELAKKLKNFEGTEAELKELLYREKYFNTRIGRKSKYSQLDVAAYFQDVIPAEYLSADFDLKNDVWRKTFNVDPKIRKGEFRLFGAPRSVSEAESQVKLVRSMIDYALDESAPLSGIAQDVNYEAWANDPKKAENAFQKMVQQLHLNPHEYKGNLYEGLRVTKDWMASNFYIPFAKKMELFPRVADWGTPVQPRPASRALRAEDRPWKGSPDPEAQKLLDKRRLAAARLEAIRENGAFINPYSLSTENLSTSKEFFENLDLTRLPPEKGLDVLYKRSAKHSPEEVKEWIAKILPAESSFPLQVFTEPFKQSMERTEWFLQHLPENLKNANFVSGYLSVPEEVSKPMTKAFMAFPKEEQLAALKSSSWMPTGRKNYGEILENLDYKKIDPRTKAILASNWDEMVARVSSPTELKEVYQVRTKLGMSARERMDFFKTLGKNSGEGKERLKSFAIRNLIEGKDRAGVQEVLQSFGTDDSERKLFGKLLEEELGSLPLDLNTMKPEETGYYLKSFYETTRDPDLNKVTKARMNEKFQKLLKAAVDNRSFESMLDIHYFSSRDPEFLTWLSSQLNDAGRSARVMELSSSVATPELQKAILNHQWKASKKRFLRNMPSAFQTLNGSVIPTETFFEFVGKRTFKPKDKAAVKVLVSKYIGHYHHYNDSRKTMKNAFSLVEKDEASMKSFFQSLVDDYNFSENQTNYFTRLYYADRAASVPLGSNLYYKTAMDAAENADPVVRALALNDIKDRLTPTGNRVARGLAFDPYPRLKQQAVDYLKRYREKLMEVSLKDLEALPPYERILQFHDLRLARIDDAKFMRALNRQEFAWAATLTPTQQEKLKTFYVHEFNGNGDPKLQKTMAEVFSNMNFQESEGVRFAVDMLQSSDAEVVEVALGKMKKLSPDQARVLLNASLSTAATVKSIELATNGRKVGQFLNDASYSADMVARLIGNTTGYRTSTEQMLSLKKSFMKLPQEARINYYLRNSFTENLADLEALTKSDRRFDKTMFLLASEKQNVISKVFTQRPNPEFAKFLQARIEKRLIIPNAQCEGAVEFLKGVVSAAAP